MEKVFRKIVSILLIVAMVMTSGGIQAFAESIDNVVTNSSNVSENKNDLTRKYYDEMKEEESKVSEELENETKENLQNSSKELNGEAPSEGQVSDVSNPASDVEPSDEEETSEELEEPEEDETTESSETEEGETEETETIGVKPLESEESKETEETSEGETNAEETTLSDDDFIGPMQLESQETSEGETLETVEETTVISDEEMIASPSDIDEENKNDEMIDEADTASASDANEVANTDIASVSDADVNADTDIASASDADLATDSELGLLDLEEMVASGSDVNLFGGWTERKYKKRVDTYVVFGDVGYDTDRQCDQGYIGFYLGKDAIGHDEYAGTWGNVVKGGSLPRYRNFWNDGGSINETQQKANMMPPDFYAPVSWYVSGGRNHEYGFFLDLNEYEDNDTGRFQSSTAGKTMFLNEAQPPAKFREYWDRYKRGEVIPYITAIECSKSGGTQLNTYRKHSKYDKVKNNLSKRLKGADLANHYNYQNLDFLSNNKNIRGYIIDGDQDPIDGNYKLKKVEGVSFNNDWSMQEVETVSSWRIDGLDDNITMWTSGAKKEKYDWHEYFKSTYYGIHTVKADNQIETQTYWKVDDGDATTRMNMYINQDQSSQTLKFKVPRDTKDTKWFDDKGNEYRLIGWTPEPHKFKYYSDFDDEEDDDLERAIAQNLNANLLEEYTTNLVWKPGHDVSYVIPKENKWPMTFGPFYRQRRGGNDRDGKYLIDDNDWGMADKGANCIVGKEYKDKTWSMISKVRRGNDAIDDFHGSAKLNEGGEAIQYNVLFLSPVLKKVVSHTVTLYPESGVWTDTKKSDARQETFTNFDKDKILPWGDDTKDFTYGLTRTGYKFWGWYTEKNGGGTGTDRLNQTTIENNITQLYANWDANNYNFIVHSNPQTGSDGTTYGESLSDIYLSQYYDQKIKMPKADDFAIEGFTLLGFAASADATTATWEAETEYYVNTTNFPSLKDSYDIYPIYQEKTYKVKFNPGSVTKASDGKGKTGKGSAEYTLSYYSTYNFSTTSDVSLEGFNLQGYNRKDKQGSVEMPAGEDIVTKDYVSYLSETSETSFYGVWKEKEYKIQFKSGKQKGSDGVEYTSTSVDKIVTTYKYYSNVTGPNDFVLEGFTATGFAKSGSSKSIVGPGKTVAIKSIYKELLEGGTTQLYTIWKEKEVNIIFAGGRKKASDNNHKESTNKVEKAYPYKKLVSVPQDFSMEGFNFKGFNTEDEKDNVTLDISKDGKETAAWYVSTYGATGDKITFYGVWEEKEYSLKFEAGTKEVNGKTYKATGSIAAKTYGYFNNVPMPNTPTMRGFKLVGFSNSDNSDTAKYAVDELIDIKDLISYIPMEEKTSDNTTDYTLYGVWEITGATIKLDADLGVFLSNHKREKDFAVSVAGLPLGDYVGYEEPHPEEGYIFTHWIDSEGNKYTSDTVIIGDIELTAQYVKDTSEETNNKTYTININNDDVKGTYTGPDSFGVKLGSDILASMSEAYIVEPVANARYTFLGWSWTGSEDDIIKTGDVYDDITKDSITAIYSEDKLTINLSAGLGEFALGLKAKTIISTESKALNEYSDYEEPTLLGHVFSKWVDENDVEIASTSIITADTTLFAQFVDVDGNVVEDTNVYTITITNDDTKGTYTGATEFGLKVGSDILASMSEAGVTNPIATPGYIFLGWSWSDSADDLIKVGDLYTDSTLNTVKAIYVISDDNVIKVVLSAGEGTFVGGVKSKSIVSNGEAALATFTGYEEPTRDDYDFIRWLDVNGVEVATSSVIKNNTTLFASYKQIGSSLEDGNYTVIIENADIDKGTLKVDGVERESVKISMREGDDILVTLASYSITVEAKDDYHFVGWSWTGDIDNIIKPGDKYTDTKNTRLIAVWKETSKFTVLLRANTGLFESNNSRRLTIKTDDLMMIALENLPGYEKPVKENASFSYWKRATDSSVFAENAFVTGDLILDAIYTDNTTGEEIGNPDDGSGTQDGGENATYTVMIKNEVKKGTMSNSERKTIESKEYDTALIDFKLGDKILDKIEDKGLTIESATGFVFEGWSKTTGEDGLVKADTEYDDKDLTDIYSIYYNVITLHITLDANTGLFKSYERTKVLPEANIKTALKDFTGYEEPFKSDEYTFNHWEDASGNKYELTHVFDKDTTITLRAIYVDNKGNVVGKGGSEAGGEKARYTVLTKYDPQKSSVSNTSFEVKFEGLVKQAMKDYKAYEATKEAEGWWQKGWSFENNLASLVTDTTIYADVNKTLVHAQYVNVNEWTIVLDANTGLFNDNTRVKTLTNKNRLMIKDFPGYERPVKSEDYTFFRWEDKDGNVYPESDRPDDPVDFILYAIYKDKNGNEIGRGDTKNDGDNATFTIRATSSELEGTIEGKDRFEVRIGDYILATMSYAGINDPSPEPGNYFVGWAWAAKDYDHAIADDDTYKGSEGTVVYALYSNQLYDVTLKANTGLFSDDTRVKTLQVPKYKLLRTVSGYEEPVKTNAKFDRWQKEDGTAIMNFRTYKIEGAVELVAIYKDNDGNDVGKDSDGTGEDGENATYTIRVNNVDSMGEYNGAHYFEIKKGEVVYTTMKAAGVKEATPSSGYAFKGWRLGNDSIKDDKLITATSTYDNTGFTVLFIEYSTQTTLVTFDASFGAFADGSRIKRYTLARGRVLNTIEEYEEPTKKKWTFNRWADKDGNTVASSSIVPMDAYTFELKAKYLNKDGIEVDEDAHKHLICGAVDEIASHDTDVISSHFDSIAYLPITSAEEFYKYIDDELAKPELERQDIRMYLEEPIELDRDIELGNNINLYICLNGYTLESKKFGNEIGKIGSIYITNCKDHEVSVIEKATGSDIDKPFFGGNSVHVLTSKGKINVAAAGRLVDVVSTASALSKDIEFMNVDIANGEGVITDNFMSATGNSKIRLVNTNINNISVRDTLIGTYEGGELYVGGNVNFIDNYTNRAIVELNDRFNVSLGAVLIASSNTIEKKENGDTAVFFIGGTDNKVYGDFKVTNNKLILSDEYKKLVKVEPVVVEDDPASPSEAEDDDSEAPEGKKLFGTYDEEVSPAGEVGYSSAVAFTNDNIGFVIGNSAIEIYGNESVASYSDVRAGYMYQLRAKENSRQALLRQNIGTNIKDDSIIGIAFAGEDGEGLLTDSKKIGQEVFVNNTFGKEEKLLNIKEVDKNLELLRKRYQVEYDEGTPTTNETKKVIESYLSDGSTISEATRVRSKEMKAGHDVLLEGGDIYKTKGFALSTYSIIDKNNKVVGLYDPKATMSYIGDIFRDGADIEDGDVFRAVSNWEEKALTSEARELVITKEEYDEMLTQAAEVAVIEQASISDVTQVEEVKEDDYYTVVYHLNGGIISGHEDDVNKATYSETGISRKDKYVLLTDVSKVATESGVSRSYDFIGWTTEPVGEDFSDIDSIDFGTDISEYDGDVVDVYAVYLPSTFKITYDLNGGKIEGHDEDVIEDIISRTSDYTLLKGVTKEDYIFTEWEITEGDSTYYADVISAGKIKNDIVAVAQYENALYSVTYDLDGGVITGITNECDETFVDERANILRDYYLYSDVTKPNHRFDHWETTDGSGVIVDMIKAGDTDSSKRSVIAIYKPTTWTISYDTDDGTIEGKERGNIIDTQPEGKDYVLYTNVTKQGNDFEYWYDINTNEKVEKIVAPKGGSSYAVKAKYVPSTYDIKLHLSDDFYDETEIETITVSNKTDFVLPTDITKENFEFNGWYKIEKNDSDITAVPIEVIPAGNPDNITDVYADFEDLMTHTVIYHLGPDEYITGVTKYDSTSTAEDRTITIKKNRRKTMPLYLDVTREGYEFLGWTQEERYEPCELTGLRTWIIQTVQGGAYTKEQEESYTWTDVRNTTYNYYPYFTKKLATRSTLVYHPVGIDELVGFKMVDGRYIEEVNVDQPKRFVFLLEGKTIVGYTCVGLYYDAECETEGFEDISVEKLQEYAGKELDVYVKYVKSSYDITYNPNGGIMEGKSVSDDTYTEKILYNTSEVKLNANAKKDGCVFDGWYTATTSDGVKVETIAKGHNEDVVVYAHWKRDKYNVTYVLDGGIVSGKPANTFTESYSRKEKNKLAIEASKEGYRFDGWYTKENGQGTKIEEIAASDEEINDITLYANYINSRYKVTYVLGGGLLKGKVLNASGSYIETYDNKEVATLISANDVINNNAIFVAWEDADKKTYQTIPEGHIGDIVLTAQYSYETVDITFDIGEKAKADGKITKDGQFTEKYNLGAEIVLPTNVRWKNTKTNAKTKISYEEYYFGGWYVDSGYNGTPITTIPKGNPNNITKLYAKWLNGTYQIIYHLDGGEIPGLSRNKIMDVSFEGTVKYEEYELPNAERKYCEFLGWYTDKGYNGTPITKLEKMPKQVNQYNVVELYAKWNVTKYVANYVASIRETYAGGGSHSTRAHKALVVENAFPYVLETSTASNIVNAVARPGYSFDGWYTDENCEGTEIVYIPAKADKEVTLYAKFVKLSDLDEEGLVALEERANERLKKIEEAEKIRKDAINLDSQKVINTTKEELKPGQTRFYSQYMDEIINEDVTDAQNKLNQGSSETAESRGLFGAIAEFASSIGKALFGDDDDSGSTTPAASPSEIQVRISDLLAYDTVSEKNLGIVAPAGTYLDSIIITYIRDLHGNFINDYDYVATVLPVGSNLAELADKYPSHIFGARAIFVDSRITAVPTTPGYYYDGGGRRRGGGGGGGGGRMPSAVGNLIVNPYGFDGRGTDNGSIRAGVVKQQVNAALGRNATPSYVYYKTIDLAGVNTKAFTEAGDTWEYFPASNAFKLFTTDPHGQRYYYVNGWYKSIQNSKINWYKFDKDGLMVRGFVEEGNKIYYLNNGLNELAYMVKGFKDFEGTGYTGYFGEDGSLVTIFPTSARASYESNVFALPSTPNFDYTTYAMCKQKDDNSTKILKTKKAFGQSNMGNFVGYWYYMATGKIKFGFETINTELQVARFANDGWINIYDSDNQMYSYRFDDEANLLLGTLTPEGTILDSSGHVIAQKVMFDFKTSDKSAFTNYALAGTTINSLPGDPKVLQSHLVTYDGSFVDTSPATDLWTEIDFSSAVPIITNTAYSVGALTPVSVLSANNIANLAGPTTYSSENYTAAVANQMKPLNAAKTTQMS